MPLPDLTDLDSVKAYAGINSAATDSAITQLITGASAVIRAWTNRDFSPATYDIRRSGRGQCALQMPQYPITGVSLVEVDGNAIASSNSFSGAGYRFDDTQVVLIGCCFTRGFANVHVVFTAGFASIPADIALACAELVTLKLRTRDKLEVSSKSLAGETVSFTQRDMPASVATTLRQYQRIAPL